MKRKEFLKFVSEKAGVNITKTEQVLKAFVKVLHEALKAGEKVSISGLGSFLVKPTKPKVGRNPKTGEVIPIPERKKISFRPTDRLRKIINT